MSRSRSQRLTDGVLALFGLSGAGKTTILELARRPRSTGSRTHPRLNGTTLFDRDAGVNLPPGEAAGRLACSRTCGSSRISMCATTSATAGAAHPPPSATLPKARSWSCSR